jgi:predicted glutamine amidotransferase
VRIPDLDIRRFEDAQWTIDLTEETANQGYVVATHPLSLHGWQSFQHSELLVLEAGQVRFSSHRKSGERPA